MDKIETLRVAINGILNAQADIQLRNKGFVHLFGVSDAAVLLAYKRGLDSALCAAAAMLHDIYTFRTGVEKDHAIHGAAEASGILQGAGGFSGEEVGIICHTILRHSDKQAVDGPYEECLKDADVLAHWLYDPQKGFNRAKKARLLRVMGELGFNAEIVEE